MSLTLDDIREAYRKLGPPPPSLKGSPWICAGEAYVVTYTVPFKKGEQRVIVMNDEELEILLEEEGE
jgi:hypothetical protein